MAVSLVALKKVFFTNAPVGLPEVRNIMPEHDHQFTAWWDQEHNLILLKPKAGNNRGSWRIPMVNVGCFQLAPTQAKGKLPEAE